MSQPIERKPDTSAAPAVGKQRHKRTVSVGQILAGILFVLVVVFIAENRDDVKIRLIAGPRVTAPIWIALVIAAVVGALISALMRHRRKKNHGG